MEVKSEKLKIKSHVGMSWKTFSLKEITVNLDNKRKSLNETERNKISKKQLYPYWGPTTSWVMLMNIYSMKRLFVSQKMEVVGVKIKNAVYL